MILCSTSLILFTVLNCFVVVLLFVSTFFIKVKSKLKKTITLVYFISVFYAVDYNTVII